jgi:alkanesulfonate monooxygenase SsuD/methylene tetrahydromethanopterin reductase-like flavin-dependent oxidoreductase (luciferase family)
MDEAINKLKTPEECIQFANKCTDLAREARRRAIELRALTHTNVSLVETELWKALYAYEEILTKKNQRRTLAGRTRQMITRYGIIGTAERAVNRKIEAMGYKVLVEMGMQDLTFESVITKFPESFTKNIVTLCKERLDVLKKIT